MYSYKLNNSYTVYVNYTYLNDCIKESKKYKDLYEFKSSVSQENIIEKKILHSFEENSLIYHKVYGYGKVHKNNEAGYISIVFGDVIRKFLYPQAFDMGYLTKK